MGKKKIASLSVGWEFTKLLYTLIFDSENLPLRVDRLDEALTNHCTRKNRTWWVNRINGLTRPRFVRRFIEKKLNKNTPLHEQVHLTLDVELSHEKIYLKESVYRQKWANWYENHCSEPRKFLIPGTGKFPDFDPACKSHLEYDYDMILEIVGEVKKAEEKGRKIRALGSGHALTPVAQSDDYLVCTQYMNVTQRPAKEFIKSNYRDGFEVDVHFGNTPAKETHYLFETSGGTKIRHLIEVLEKYGLYLMNQGGSSIQSISGALATSTHGSGIGLGPVPSMVRSITLVGTGGKVYRIEPSDGITDPSLFEGKIQGSDVSVELVQDDEAFHAVLVGVGSMGIIVSLILEVQPIYRLYEERIVRNWEAVKSEIKTAPDLYSYLNANRHFEILINPYIDPDSDSAPARKCLVTTRNYAAAGTKKSNSRMERNYLSSFISGINISGKLSPWVFNQNPDAIPRMIDNSLNRIEDHAERGEGFEDIARKVLDQGLGELKFYGFATEYGIELNRVLEAVDLILSVCGEAATYKHYLAAPFSLRFVKHCPAYMSMMNTGDICMIELVSVRGVTGSLTLLKRLETELIAFGAIPHWGLSVQPWAPDMVAKAFPKFPIWKKMQAKFGGKTFLNPFMEDILAESPEITESA
ncbi:FAD/FMN-containing dehydrogenase [Lunatimonas lonarensis]|uniref:FAD/FMN-containing dehydrogenase n=1 Tax=Lunatimonas lonarensis TaxID=1232681 RepID=R7ZR91_9BACT|nr:FAD-binding protein [Lunatimonas lonarensis]EON76630.1 FAD/FMN-containing dehydrogenase [Lunatimonas lonarensis]